MSYKNKILSLVIKHPLNIDTDIQIEGKAPTAVSSEFITNKEQGDWAERIVFDSINKENGDYIAVRYGRNDNVSAGDEGFKEFYLEYLNELNTIGKKPDILIFRKTDYPIDNRLTDEIVSKAVCALEVRSSSFLVEKYTNFMDKRSTSAWECIKKNVEFILKGHLGELLKKKNPTIYSYLESLSRETVANLNFRAPSWSTSADLVELSRRLKEIKKSIKVIQKRDYLSITPKLEDIALVNRWIQKYGVPHYYLQVFFDRGYIISFQDILEISSDSEKEGKEFSVESDIKNQGKRTIKININDTEQIIDKIDMPSHYSAMKELDRGRLLFYVKFVGGKGYLNHSVFDEIIK